MTTHFAKSAESAKLQTVRNFHIFQTLGEFSLYSNAAQVGNFLHHATKMIRLPFLSAQISLYFLSYIYVVLLSEHRIHLI